MPSLGSMIVASGTTPAWSELYVGGNGTALAVNSEGMPEWTSLLKSGIYIGATLIEDSRIEINFTGSGNRYAYIDFHGDGDTSTDYSFRIIRGNAGANAITQLQHRGTGDFSLYNENAATIAFLTSSTTRGYFGSVGHFYTSTGNYIYLGGQGTYHLRYDSSYYAIDTNAHFKTSNSFLAAGALYLGYPTQTSYSISWDGTYSAYHTNANIKTSSHLLAGAYLFLGYPTQTSYYMYWDSSNLAYHTNGSLYSDRSVLSIANMALYAQGSNMPDAWSGWVTWKYYSAGGDIYFCFNGGTSTYYSPDWIPHSDKRLKRNIRDLEKGNLDKVLQLKPKRFLFREDKAIPPYEKEDFGLVADDVVEVFPELVGVSPGEDQLKTLDYKKLSVFVVAAIQELEVRVKKMEVNNG